MAIMRQDYIQICYFISWNFLVSHVYTYKISITYHIYRNVTVIPEEEIIILIFRMHEVSLEQICCYRYIE